MVITFANCLSSLIVNGNIYKSQGAKESKKLFPVINSVTTVKAWLINFTTLPGPSLTLPASPAIFNF